MNRKSVFVDEITADWLEQELADVAKTLRERGAKDATATAQADRDAAVAAARLEGVEAERKRLLGIEEAAFPGQEELVAKLKADPKMTVEAAKDALIADEKGKRKKHLDAMRKDESSLTPPDPGNGKDPDAKAQNVSRILGVAKRAGLAPAAKE